MKRYLVFAQSFVRPLLWVLVLLLPASLAAHPHVFIDGVLGPKVSAGELLGTKVRWSFDQIYSAQMILDFDTDKSGQFEAAEVQNIYKEAFVHLDEFHYFLQIREDVKGVAVGKESASPYKIGTAKDFNASIEDGKIIYEFFVPFETGSKEGISLENGKTYVAFLEDKEYFIAFDSLLQANAASPSAQFGNKEFTVQNLQWGPYPVRAVSIKGL